MEINEATNIMTTVHHLEGHAHKLRLFIVSQLRDQGASWDTVGKAIGMSGVGAMKRYRPILTEQKQGE